MASASGNATGNASGNGAGAADRNSPEIITLLDTAEKALIDGRCDQYYRDSLSPAFRKAVSARALDTLINGCRNSIGNREVLIAALRVVRRLSPRYEFDGNRASYDVAGQGLPFDRFVLERIERRWYIAE